MSIALLIAVPAFADNNDGNANNMNTNNYNANAAVDNDFDLGWLGLLGLIGLAGMKRREKEHR